MSPETVYINYITINQILVLKVAQAAFGLSDIHECLGFLQMPPSPLDSDKQTAGSVIHHTIG